MDSDLLSEAIFQLLRARYPKSGYISLNVQNNTKCVVGEYVWYVSIEAQIDMDMVDCVRFEGGGSSVLAGFADIFAKVVKDQQSPALNKG